MAKNPSGYGGVGRGRGRGAVLRTSVPQIGKLYAPTSIVDNKSGDVLPAVPGQCKIQDSWRNITKAPVAYQMQMMIGDQYSDHAMKIKNKDGILPIKKGIQHEFGNHKEFVSKNKFREDQSKEQKENKCELNSSNSLLSNSRHSKSSNYSGSDSSLNSASSSSSDWSNRHGYTKFSFVGSNSSIPTLADEWVPMDFDSPKMYENSQFSSRR